MMEVDAVITWVDGADPALARKRNAYLSDAITPLHDNGINPHRWVCSDELNFCLRSIANNAPWVRRVWIVTDNQMPDIAPLPGDFASKIAVVDHAVIFADHADALRAQDLAELDEPTRTDPAVRDFVDQPRTCLLYTSPRPRD